MPRAEGPVRAIGRLSPDGTWVGFQEAPSGYRLVFGLADGSIVSDPTHAPGPLRDGLIASAVAYFSEALGEPPPDFAATQADLAALVRHLRAGATNASAARLAQEAIDAIDDGLSGDAVALRVAALSPGPAVDPVQFLGERLRLATAPASR